MPSNKIKKEKETVVTSIQEKISNAKSFVLVDYLGLTVEQDTEFRNALRKAGVEYKVSKNTLTAIAAKNLGIVGLEKYLSGSTAIASSTTDLTAPAKVVSIYAKKFKSLEIKAGYVDGNVIDAENVNTLAALPPRELLVAMVLRGLNAPVTGFVNVLNGNLRGLVVALNAIAESKQGA